MKYFCTIFLFLSVLNIAAQKVVASLPELNVIYLELDNEIEISAEGYKESDLVKKTINATLIKKDGKQFIKPLKRGEALLIVGTFKNKDTLWLDTTEFRARILPKPHPQMGTIQDGEIQSIGVIRANANRLFLSYGEGFMVKGFRGNILGFTCTIIDSSGIDSWDVEGSGITAEIKNRLMRISDYGKIIFSDFEYCVTKNEDTIITPRRLKDKKVIITVRPQFIKASLIATEEEKEAFYHNHPAYSIKGQFKDITDPFYYNSLYTDNNYLQNNIGKIKIGKWKYFTKIGNEQYLYIEEDYDTTGNLISYKKYDKSGINIINVKFSRNIDSTYYIEKYPNGNIKKEGWVYKYGKNFTNLGELTKSYHGTLSRNPYRESYEAMKFTPFGTWKEYYENGKLKLTASFKRIIDYEYYENYWNLFKNNESISFGINTVFHGLWIEYDEKGNEINKWLYNKGYWKEE